jgi:ABC-type nitrate/sulfonate/bicarbonate transport system substrate-binding protein
MASFNRLTAKTELAEAIAENMDKPFADEQARIEKADELIEAYVTATDERPDGKALNDLSTFILKDFIDSKDQNKKNQENSFLTDSQYHQRIIKEKSDIHAQTFGTDGKNHKGAVRTHKKY